jgi:hypothetical protein
MASWEAEERERAWLQHLRRSHEGMMASIAAHRRADENGLRNQRLAELTQALRGLSADAWRGLDPARAAERVLPILESMVDA